MASSKNYQHHYKEIYQKVHYISKDGELLHREISCNESELITSTNIKEVNCQKCLNKLFGYKKKLSPRAKGVCFYSTMHIINELSSFCQIRYWLNKNVWIFQDKELCECILERVDCLIGKEINSFMISATKYLREEIQERINEKEHVK